MKKTLKIESVLLLCLASLLLSCTAQVQPDSGEILSGNIMDDELAGSLADGVTDLQTGVMSIDQFNEYVGLLDSAVQENGGEVTLNNVDGDAYEQIHQVMEDTTFTDPDLEVQKTELNEFFTP